MPQMLVCTIGHPNDGVDQPSLAAPWRGYVVATWTGNAVGEGTLRTNRSNLNEGILDASTRQRDLGEHMPLSRARSGHSRWTRANRAQADYLPNGPAPKGHPRPRVLHVTEAMGGGSATALHEVVRHTPGVDHSLLFAARERFSTGARHEDLFVDTQPVSGGLASLTLALYRTVKREVPDLVHLHSIWAGAIGRLVVPLSIPIIYSPHSYFFERTNLPSFLAPVAELQERLLNRLTSVVVAVSPHEQRLAERLGCRAHFVPNTVQTEALPTHQPVISQKPRIISVGRLSAQKDPYFFADTVEAASRRGVEAHWIWVGDGDSAAKLRLEAAGVELTGWLSRDLVVAHMRDASLYVHTAAWEGNPMVLLEAQAIGLPVAARSISALVSLGYDNALTTPDRLAARISGLLQEARGNKLTPPTLVPQHEPAPLSEVYASLL